jgi:hypothetical protein
MQSKYLNTLLIIALICTLISCSKKLNYQDKSHKFYPIRTILIADATGVTGPCEPSISINPSNPEYIVAGAVLNHVFTSSDGGKTWSKFRLKSTYGVYGDPVVRYDMKGNVYYAHLSDPKGRPFASQEFLDRIVVQKSTDNGLSWNNGTYPPVDHMKDHDKQWISVDPITGNILMSWTEFDKYGSKKPQDKSRILFSISTDEGESWMPAIAISQFDGDCLDDDMTTEGAHPAVGTDGTYFVAWSYNEKIYLDISGDKGITWLDKDIVVTDQPGGWSFNISGIGRCNGMPVLKADHSGGNHHGTLYLNWSDQRNGLHDTDIWLSKSTDNGRSWSQAIRVNNDKPGKHQFFSWMDIDQTTGYVYIVFYDRRNYNDETTDVYLAYSTDGGNSFSNIKINETSFKPETTVFFGDYNDISAYNGKIRPIWTQQERLKLSVHTALIDVIKSTP